MNMKLTQMMLLELPLLLLLPLMLLTLAAVRTETAAEAAVLRPRPLDLGPLGAHLDL